MRTTVNYQYRYGTNTIQAIKTLYAEGGIRRFYRGVGPALFQGPLSRFGDTASNAGMLALWDSMEFTQSLPTALKTVTASAAAAGFRVFLMPIDACKTILQVEGADGLTKLRAKIGKGGPLVLYHGSIGAMSATFVGHYPWFYTYNYLNKELPQYDRKKQLPQYLARNAVIGAPWPPPLWPAVARRRRPTSTLPSSGRSHHSAPPPPVQVSAVARSPTRAPTPSV